MSKEEVIAWFRSTNDVSAALAGMEPATEPLTRPSPDVRMVLASIRLPVVLVEQVDHLAGRHGVRRSDVIRDALAEYVVQRTAPVSRNEAERALDVLRRVVETRVDPAA